LATIRIFVIMKTHYTEADALPRLVFLDGWSFKDDGIEKEFLFRDFVDAFSFMTRVAMEAQRIDHHPDWKNLYNMVHLRLSTHDAGGLTDRDFLLAEIIEKRILSK
jgi:4a-hydroxytetrahydrobiopterin dehydratase